MTQRQVTTARLIIVVIDDDLAVRNSLKFSLEIEGLMVRSYANGLELLNADDLDRCACFVVDQKMPGMTGLDLIAALRARQINAPAILITSQPNLLLRERTKSAGIPIIEKPLLGNALFDKIRDVVANDHQ